MNTISNLMLPTDLEAAYQIEQACHSHPWSQNTFLSNQGEHYLNLKIMVDNIMVGFAITHIVCDEATLFNIAIKPEQQRRGLAKQLMNYLITQLIAMGIQTLWLEVRASNHAAQQLYQQLGFNCVTIRANYYPSDNGHEDAIIMARYL